MKRLSQTILFARQWLSEPWSIGAVAPSSPHLARLMTQSIDASTGPVLELGPGTGVFTDALLERGVQQQCLTLVELGEDFVRLLRLLRAAVEKSATVAAE